MSREYSLRILAELRGQFASAEDRLRPLTIIAAAGSLGRLEAGANSDLDSIIIVDDAAAGRCVGEETMTWWWGRVAAVGLRIPKPGGVFREPISRAELLAQSAIGRIDESPSVFGKRIQILLDARAVYGEREFAALRNDILDWYLAPASGFRMPNAWSYLLADLLRYGNSYSNWQSATLTRTADDSWALRQVKLRSTRFVTWMGLWLLIQQAHRFSPNGIEWIRDNLALTPLERIRLVVEPESPAEYERVHQHYQAVHSLMQRPEVRAQLISSELPRGESEPADARVVFAKLLEHCLQIRHALSRFVTDSLARNRDIAPALSIPF